MESLIPPCSTDEPLITVPVCPGVCPNTWRLIYLLRSPSLLPRLSDPTDRLPYNLPGNLRSKESPFQIRWNRCLYQATIIVHLSVCMPCHEHIDGLMWSSKSVLWGSHLPYLCVPWKKCFKRQEQSNVLNKNHHWGISPHSLEEKRLKNFLRHTVCETSWQ